MNKLGCYSYYDKKAERFDTPFFTYSDLFAERHFINQVTKRDTILSHFKEDFHLERLGYVILETGKFIEDKRIILEGKQIENKKE